MEAGLHVYCEKPMTKQVDEAMDVVRCWKKTGKIMQVGVQSTSLPLWSKVNELLREGKLGKVLMYQTEFFRNSIMGQWRYYKLKETMNPSNIDWKTWLGVEEGLAEDMPFDRAVYAQWRRFWPFGSGMFTDLFVHRTTSMMKATGLRYPGRVTGAGGIFLEYDGRHVPDVATVVADFKEGVQGLVTATMCCQNTPIRQLIRGHFGSFSFGNGEQFEGIRLHSGTPASHARQQAEGGTDRSRPGAEHDQAALRELGRRDGGGRPAEVQQPARPGRRGHRHGDPRCDELSVRQGLPFQRRDAGVQRRRRELGQGLGRAFLSRAASRATFPVGKPATTVRC